jgi:hypothetical protein
MQTGGIIKVNSEITNLDAIMNIINNKNAEVHKAFFASTVGIVFNIKLPNANICTSSSLYGFNIETKRHDKPLDTFVIKLAILKEGEWENLEVRDLEKYNITHKETDNINNFKREAVLQSKVYSETLSKGSPICPAILDLFIFDYELATTFLEKMKLKCSGVSKQECEDVLVWISSILGVNENYKLGALVMESASNYKMLRDEIKERNDIRDLYNLYKNFLIKIIRLYIESRIIPFELHGGNVLSFKKENGEFEMFIIDFGAMGDFSAERNDARDVTSIINFINHEEFKYRKRQYNDRNNNNCYIKNYVHIFKNICRRFVFDPFKKLEEGFNIFIHMSKK